MCMYAITFLISVEIFDIEIKNIKIKKGIYFKKKMEEKFKKFETLLPRIELGAADCRSNGLTTVPPMRPSEVISRNACDGKS